MKRIITCSDGTWNKPGTKDRGQEVCTNVEKMFNSICPLGLDKCTGQEIIQVKAYDEGVGTGYSTFDRLTGGITGAGIDKNIKDMYAFICLNYKPGDEIYLYGFSRGAYTARSIAGFIRNCGLLAPQYIHLVDKAYNLYRDRNDYSSPESDMMSSWRRNYCLEENTSIHFIGVWDTVGSLGLPLPFYKSLNNLKYRFHDHRLSSLVRHAYHALALDERRKLFSPTLWEKSKTVLDDKNHPQKMEQRWFVGAHSNIGGGYIDCGLSDIALNWLIKKAEDAGLCFYNPPKVDILENYKGELRNSYTSRYWLWRPVWRNVDIHSPVYNQTIDDSVGKRYREFKEYRPGNLKGLADSI